jgi:hypothetical protein
MALRNSALVVCCGLLMTAPVMGQEKVSPEELAAKAKAAEQQAATPAATDGPQITFDKVLHDFGVINDDKPVETEFRFTNNGKTTLTLSQPQGSCGCTVPHLSKLSYEPGESGTIKVSYNPHNRRGKQHTKVTVNSNDTAHPSTILDVHSEIKPQMMVDPTLVNLGQIMKGQASSTTVTITSRTKELAPMQATPSSPAFAAVLGETKEVMENGETLWKTPLEVSVLPTAQVGSTNGNITVRTSDPARTLSFSAMCEVLGDIDVRPARVQFNAVSSGAPLTNQVRLTNRKGEAFKVLKVEDVARAGQVLTVSVKEDPADKNAWLIDVTGVAPAQGSFHGEIVVTTDLASENTVKVPYFGFVRQNPQPNTMQASNPTGAPSPWDANPSILVPGR